MQVMAELYCAFRMTQLASCLSKGTVYEYQPMKKLFYLVLLAVVFNLQRQTLLMFSNSNYWDIGLKQFWILVVMALQAQSYKAHAAN